MATVEGVDRIFGSRRTKGMSLTACAQIVEKGDPERFLATMAAPPGFRTVLFPLYAMNVEVARAPWVSAEPIIGEMRLQWWADALEEIAAGGPVRRHEVVTPLADVLDAEGAGCLIQGVAARRWDLYQEPFADEAAFWAYLDATAAGLLWTAARLLGAPSEAEAPVRALGRAQGLAHWLRAIPALEARGRMPLVDGRPEAVRDVAQNALKALKPLPKLVRPVCLATWLARPTLTQVIARPEAVKRGALAFSEFGKRARLLAAVLGLRTIP